MSSEATKANTQMVRSYLAAIESGATGAALAKFFDPNVIQEKFPNRVFANGMKRNFAAILESADRGAKLFASQRYEIQRLAAEGNFVAVEYIWVGKLAKPAGTLSAGQEMRGHFAVFIEFRNGRIVAQSNYDCFDPW